MLAVILFKIVFKDNIFMWGISARGISAVACLTLQGRTVLKTIYWPARMKYQGDQWYAMQ